jgi:hypothetical protein
MIRRQCARAGRSSSRSPPLLVAKISAYARRARSDAGSTCCAPIARARAGRGRRLLGSLSAARSVCPRGCVRRESADRMSANSVGCGATARTAVVRLSARPSEAVLARADGRVVRSTRSRRGQRSRRHARRTGSVGVQPWDRAVQACRTRARSCARVPRARSSFTGQATARACRGRTARAYVYRREGRSTPHRAAASRRARRRAACAVVRVKERAALASLARRERRSRARRRCIDGEGAQPEPAAAANWVLADSVTGTVKLHTGSSLRRATLRFSDRAGRRARLRDGDICGERCGRECVVLCEGVGARTSAAAAAGERTRRERERPGGVRIVSFRAGTHRRRRPRQDRKRTPSFAIALF